MVDSTRVAAAARVASVRVTAVTAASDACFATDARAQLDPDALLKVPGARLLVLAPHPDDESLAAGGLIQRACATGVPVCVVFVTDGENNPWPQRVLERRLRIGARERAAWGQRRRGEAAAALRMLGAHAASVHWLGWPDGGLTRRLMEPDSPLRARLHDLLTQERPTLLVVPELADRHPDHAALHVLVELVVAGMPPSTRPLRLGYVVHGSPGHAVAMRTRLRLDANELAGKRNAIRAHASQMALGGSRWLRRAGAAEVFLATADVAAAPTCMVLPWLPPRWLRPWLALLVVDAEGASTVRLGRRAGATMLRWRDGSPAASVPRALRARAFVKLRGPSTPPWIFDIWGWCRIRP